MCARANAKGRAAVIFPASTDGVSVNARSERCVGDAVLLVFPKSIFWNIIMLIVVYL